MQFSGAGPIIIGGTGGSGTRVVAQIIQSMGVFLGSNLNASSDALDIAAFDWRYGKELLIDGPSESIRTEFCSALERHRAGLSDEAAWGWKCPHSYLFLHFLREVFPDLRFVHVIRDGRDMAFSSNQKQRRRYGPLVLKTAGRDEAVNSIRYWSWANLRAARLGRRLGGSYFLLRFEDLCADPLQLSERLRQFCAATDAPDANTLQGVRPPASIGRWRQEDPLVIERLERAGRSALARFGYGSQRHG